jgi:hypothetical protein
LPFTGQKPELTGRMHMFADHRNHRRGCGLLLKTLPTALLLALGGNAGANTLVVNSLGDDTIAGNGLVTLREAILASINHTTTDAGQTGTGNDTIDLTSQSGAIGLNAVLPNITGQIAIVGPGSALLTIYGSSGHGAGDSGIFFVSDTLVLSKVTLANGTSQGGAGTTVQRDGAGGGAAGMGGAVFVNGGGKFTADYVTFTGNRAIGGGGGSTNGPIGGFYAGGGGGFGEDAPAMSSSPAYGVRATRGGNGGPFGNTGGRAGTVGNTGYAGNGGDGGGGGGGGTGIATIGGNGGFAGGAGGAGWAHCGAGPAGVGGFGGGGGGGTLCNSDGYALASGGAGGQFGGNGGDGSGTSVNSGTGGGGGGGAGLGGALFVRTGGKANLSNCRFSSNQAQPGLGGSGGGNGMAGSNGQGKGGAIFVMGGATVFADGPAFFGNSATDSGTSSTDNADVYGSLITDTIFRDDFDGDGF